MTRLAVVGDKLSPELREEVLALGSLAIPGLLTLLNDDSLHTEDSPGGGWPPIHAVGLLADLKATEAIEPMLRLLCETGWDEIIHDRIIQRLGELGPSVVEPALALIERGASEDVHHSICCVLAEVGVRDPRIFEQLCALFDREEVSGAICLSGYGDPAALPILEGAIEDFEPDFESVHGLMDLTELIDSYERVGGVLSEDLQQHVAATRADFEAYRARFMPRRAEPKPGRNDPCPCGSGKKYKRCCLE
jgi:hypothetical protein